MDFGWPAWLFGMCSYAFLPGKRYSLVCFSIQWCYANASSHGCGYNAWITG